MTLQELRDKYDIDNLLNATINNREEKEALDVVIAGKRGELMTMLSTANAEDSQAIHDALYDLKTAKYRIQTQLAKIARANIAKRK